MSITISTLQEILYKLDPMLPAPEINKIVGENEDWHEVKDYSIEWCTNKGHVELSLYSRPEKEIYKDLYAHHREKGKWEGQFLYKDEDASIENLKKHLQILYKNTEYGL